MKRQKKPRSAKQPSLFSGANPLVVERITGIALIALIITATLISGAIFVERSDYFRLKSVETRSTFLDQRTIQTMNTGILNLYRGFNIFRINLKNISDSIQKVYPDAKDVSVRIALPDKLLISMKFRRPVAIVKDGKLYPVDEEGYVLPSMDASSLGALPVIEGVGIRYDERKGKRSNSRNLQYALELIRESRRHRFMTEQGLASINASDPKDISFFLKNGVEVKIGTENYPERFDALERTLKDPRLLLDRIRYIDVRFKDVTIGPK